ncbi:Thiol-disulfide oxidoreductase ResA [Corynebacterium faecale]|uniref:TlpA family protein disulfide reductase n=1 Tax=Corynebacterium faecale TaxID=1758466 RepID=UPI0025B461E7|nr:TlpA disulfide reductase family protein [Corynebacterium faecale]WJY92487.1 Thiol-disulfide oxidoreductase ResA [Corynebacterium faecale]
MSRVRPGVITAALAVLTTLTLTACTSGEAAQNAVALGGTFQFHSPGGQTEIFYTEEQRAPLPNFSGQSLMEDGKQINLSDFEGEVVVLNAWGQWCAPCRAEVDDLQIAQDTLEPLGGTVLGINVRDYNQTIAQDFILDNGVTYPSIYDPPFRTAASLGGVPTSVVPTTIILDREHRPAAVFLREVDADDILDVALPLTEEAPQS